MNVAGCHWPMGLIPRQVMPEDGAMPSRTVIQKHSGTVSRNRAPGAPRAGFETAVL